MPIKLTPRQALNKAFLKIKPLRNDIDNFKKCLKTLLESIKDEESEEHQKNLLRDFFKQTHYGEEYFINTKQRTDLVIHNGKASNDTVGVLIEVKRTTNSGEMLSEKNINCKAMQELLLYYLRERITNQNIELKHIVATNIKEWFIFDANIFEKQFAQDKKLIKQYEDFTREGKDTSFFYNEIAKKFIDKHKEQIAYVHINLEDYKKIVLNKGDSNDSKLIPPYKIFSAEHMLKKPFLNDGNTLNKNFYVELLHLIGLEETKEGTKKIIERKSESNRNNGSLLEQAISIIESRGRLYELDNPHHFGQTPKEQIPNIGLELVITWINRILFLKLLEAQLFKYHKGDKAYSFLNIDNIKTFSELDALFFQVLAVRNADRDASVKEKYSKIPYLNSSLFEQTGLESATITVGDLSSEIKIKVISSTVLKNEQGKKKTEEIKTLDYIFKFLNAYDFTSDGGEEIQEDNKTLINASVLGLIFEKINGYKEGSFFTPSFVTMYMCKEIIRKAVVSKFNQTNGTDYAKLDEVYNSIDDIGKANEIVNSIKICDPAVGSGHFLVSALNEIIFIKANLGVLRDKNGRSLRDYTISVENDELIITDIDGEFVNYHPKNAESQRIQETIFEEKQAIIENCLFGVDINANSVKICRLRLWIELLKHSYYHPNGELETLPNIDINIKVGNSLVNRFPIETNLKVALLHSNLSINKYKKAVKSYKNATNKKEKRDVEKIIAELKAGFKSEIFANDKKVIRLLNVKAELLTLKSQTSLFENNDISELTSEKIKKLEAEKLQIEQTIKEIENNKNYQEAFEWRFEFPEILDEDGNFIGFDVVISNPPYGVSLEKNIRELIGKSYGKVPDFEIYYYFINLGKTLLKPLGLLSYIIPNTLLFNVYAKSYRLELLNNWTIKELIDCTDFPIFSDATVRNIMILLQNSNSDFIEYKSSIGINTLERLLESSTVHDVAEKFKKNNENWALILKLPKEVTEIIATIKKDTAPLLECFSDTSQGLIAYDKHQGQSEEIIKSRAYHTNLRVDENHHPWLNGEDVKRYSVIWNGKDFINYCDGIANPRKPKYFVGKRTLIREITNPRIFAALTDEEMYFDPSVIVILDNLTARITIETLLGILNSKLASYYHFNASPKATKGAFPKLLVTDINNFPIPLSIESAAAEEIHNAVIKIITNSNATDSEDVIDKLVYEIYKLDASQISVIEKYFEK
jgi:hypothetical protein